MIIFQFGYICISRRNKSKRNDDLMTFDAVCMVFFAHKIVNNAADVRRTHNLISRSMKRVTLSLSSGQTRPALKIRSISPTSILSLLFHCVMKASRKFPHMDDECFLNTKNCKLNTTYACCLKIFI